MSARSPIVQRASVLWSLCASPRTLGVSCLVWAALLLVSVAPHDSNLNPALRFGAIWVGFSGVCFASELALRAGSGTVGAWRDLGATIFVAGGNRRPGGARAALWLSLLVWALVVLPALVGYVEALPGSARGNLRVAEGEVGESFVMATPAAGTRRSLGEHGVHVLSVSQDGLWTARVQANREGEAIGEPLTLDVGGRATLNAATLVFRGVEVEARVGGVVVDAELPGGERQTLTLTQDGAQPLGDGSVRLVSVESNVLGQLGPAALLSLQLPNEAPQQRWVFERAPDGFDARHHGGIALRWVEPVPVRAAVFTVRLGRSPWLQSLALCLGWLVIAVGLALAFTRANRGDARFFANPEAPWRSR